MGIVRFALKFPYTFYVLATLVLFLGSTAILSMPTDIFPEIDIPVVTIVWQYTGLSTPEMEQRVTTYSQFALSSSVNGIQDIEAQTLNGISVQKVFFQPDVNLDLAIAQIVSATNFIRVVMPPGIQAPVVVQFNASSVPVLQIGLSSDTLNEQQLYDYGIYRLRQQLAPIHGVTLPTPAGGKYRQIMVDLDPLKLQAKGLTPNDVVKVTVFVNDPAVRDWVNKEWVALFPDPQIERTAIDIPNQMDLALMLGHGDPRGAPGQPDSTRAFVDRNPQEVRDCRIAGTFLMWLRRPCAAQIDARLPIERARKLCQRPRRLGQARQYQNQECTLPHDTSLIDSPKRSSFDKWKLQSCRRFRAHPWRSNGRRNPL